MYSDWHILGRDEMLETFKHLERGLSTLGVHSEWKFWVCFLQEGATPYTHCSVFWPGIWRRDICFETASLPSPKHMLRFSCNASGSAMLCWKWFLGEAGSMVYLQIPILNNLHHLLIVVREINYQ